MQKKAIIGLTAAAALAVGGVVASFSPETDRFRTLGNAEKRWGTVYTTAISDGQDNSINVADLAEIVAGGGGAGGGIVAETAPFTPPTSPPSPRRRR